MFDKTKEHAKIEEIGNGDEMYFRKLVLLIVCFVFILFLFVVVLGTSSVDSNTKSTAYYEYITIDGMPCIQNQNRRVLSCDWSLWDGTRDDLGE